MCWCSYPLLNSVATSLFRCNLESNIHLTGSLLRITDGLAPTTIQTCNLSGNAVTTVVRFEGRAWVFNASEWVQRIDSMSKLGGYKASQMSESMYLTLEKRRFDDMVSDAMSSLKLTSAHPLVGKCTRP